MKEIALDAIRDKIREEVERTTTVRQYAIEFAARKGKNADSVYKALVGSSQSVSLLKEVMKDLKMGRLKVQKQVVYLVEDTV